LHCWIIVAKVEIGWLFLPLWFTVKWVAIISLVDAVGQQVVAQYWQAFVLDEVLNISIIITHFGALIDELLL